MNGAHVHLLINHIPVLGVLFGFLLLTIAVVRRKQELLRVAAVTLLVVGVLAVPVYLSGEPAEEVVEEMPGIQEEFVEEHEEAGLLAFIGLEVMAVLALGALLLERREGRIPDWGAWTLWGVSAVVLAWVGWTSHLGGRIHHPEIRPDFQVQASEGGEESEGG